jgi:hypothetical protein
MNWREQASLSPYQTAMAIEQELKAGRLDSATEGLEELIDALTRSEKRALKSQLIRLMAHALKWQTQPSQRSRSWAATIANAREEIADIQEETPSLTDEVIAGMWDKCFAAAKRQAEGEMNQECPVRQLTWAEVFATTYELN